MLITQRQTDMHIVYYRVLKTGGVFIWLLGFGFAVSTFAAETDGELKLPADLAEKVESGPTPKYTIEERRSGGRLDRITVRREGGIDETYENTEVNSLWQTEDDELGETQNLRRWTIGSW